MIRSNAVNEKFLVASAFALGLGVLLAVTVVGLVAGIDVGDLTRDLAALAGSHPLYGGLSQLGIIVWAMAGGSWLVLAVLPGTDWPVRRFAIVSFILTMYLCGDDAFMVHDFLARRAIPHGNDVILGVLAVAMITYLMAYFRRLQNTPVCALGAFGFLALSVSLDVIDDLLQLRATSSLPWWLLGEDGAKWLGIVFWLALALAQISQASARSRTGLPGRFAYS